MKYKVGDRVIGIAETCYGRDIRGLKGTVIIANSDDDICVEFDKNICGHDGDGKGKAGHCWWINGLTHAEKRSVIASKVVITADGEETLARLYEGGKVVASAKATCSREDEFNFNIGARLAFDRLIGEEKTAEEWRVVHRPARVGEYIRLKESYFSFNNVGDILKVAGADENCVSVKACDHPRDTNSHSDYLWHYAHGLYEVIEPCTAVKKEEYYNGKAVCISNRHLGGDLTVGKIYDFSKNGGCGENDRNSKILSFPRKDLKTINAAFDGVIFIQYVE